MLFLLHWHLTKVCDFHFLDWTEPLDKDTKAHTKTAKSCLQDPSWLALMHTDYASLYNHSYIDLQGQQSGQQPQTRLGEGKQKALTGLKYVPPLFFETLHCGGSWLLVAGPDKSLWSLLSVSDRGWAHNRLKEKGHDIHLPDRLLKHCLGYCLVCTQRRHISHSSYAPSFLSATVPQAWEMASKSKVQYWHTAASHAYKCLLAWIAHTTKCYKKNIKFLSYFKANSTWVCLNLMLQHLVTTTRIKVGNFWSHKQYDNIWRNRGSGWLYKNDTKHGLNISLRRKGIWFVQKKQPCYASPASSVMMI